MIGIYGRLLGGVRSINGLNKLQILFENILTPLEADQFAPGLASALAVPLLAIQGPSADPLTGTTIGEKLFEHAREWCARLQRQMALAGKVEPEPFVRSRLRRDVFVFSNPEAKGRKKLLILFGGGALRPMMPVHVFLQHLDATTTDIMFLRDPARDGYRSGLFGVGKTLDDLIDRLPELIDLSGYGQVNAMGTSSGGAPALLAGLALGARSAISAGGIHPTRENWAFRGQPLSDALAELGQTTGRRTRVFLVSGAQSATDQDAAQATAALLGGTLVTVSGKDGNAVRHVSLFPLARQGHLTPVLEAMLSAEMEGLRSVRSLTVEEVAAPTDRPRN